MADINVTLVDTSVISFTISDAAPVQFKIEKFSGTPQSGYTTLSANQYNGISAISLEFTFSPNSLLILKNGIPMERNVEYSEGVLNNSFTLLIACSVTDKFEARYVKN